MLTLLLAFGLLAVAILLLGVKVLFVHGGKFPSGHIGGNPKLKQHGIICAHEQE